MSVRPVNSQADVSATLAALGLSEGDRSQAVGLSARWRFEVRLSDLPQRACPGCLCALTSPLHSPIPPGCFADFARCQPHQIEQLGLRLASPPGLPPTAPSCTLEAFLAVASLRPLTVESVSMLARVWGTRATVVIATALGMGLAPENVSIADLISVVCKSDAIVRIPPPPTLHPFFCFQVWQRYPGRAVESNYSPPFPQSRFRQKRSCQSLKRTLQHPVLSPMILWHLAAPLSVSYCSRCSHACTPFRPVIQAS